MQTPQEKSPQYYCEQIKLLSASAEKKLAYIGTYGCQQNVSDSEKLRGLLAEAGFEPTESDADADIVVINTCSVREHAEAKVFGIIGALSHKKKRQPDCVIAVCGCMTEREGAKQRLRTSYPQVDIVFGPSELQRFPEYLYRHLAERERVFSEHTYAAAERPEIHEGLPAARDKSVSAFVSIMYGCDNFCSYCVVPYVRGRERSREPEAVLDEVRELVAAGYRDITLLGQNVNSYGKGLPGAVTFPELLRRVNDIPGDFRVRFMTSHPKDAGAELFSAMAECEKVCACLHLPFQSGSTRVLTAMNRRYTREQYLEKLTAAREAIPGLVLTSDVIVGFPGETEADFEDTMSLIEQVRFDALFTFIYSPRPGAPSYLQAATDTPETIQARFDRLLTAQNQISSEIHEGYIGKRVRVLIDKTADSAEYPFEGRTEGNRLVRCKTGAPGQFRDVPVASASKWSLFE
jgi:tRNA-2-methylthio-N6-dimethylallyladenosine synthase